MASDENSGSHVAATSPSVSIPSSSRVSMEEYYDQHDEQPIEHSVDEFDSPPSYDALVQSPSRRKFNIQPREDEGRETLPPYSSAISLESVFMKKMEFEGAVHRAHDRNWYRVYVTLQGTALTFHKFKSSGVFARPEDGRKRTPDFPAGSKKGHFLRSYNLQHADVGVAADYFKKRYVIRVRAETDQFLLSCQKIETFVLWLQSLFAAIDLAPPLDDREIPRDISIPPRPRRRRARAGFGNNVEQNANLVREQTEIIRTQYPQLADPIPEETSSPDTSPPATPRPATAVSAESSTVSTRGAGLMLRARQAMASTPNLTNFSNTAPNPSVNPETGKWAPHHHWSLFHDMIYARRCMAILTCRAPRKSNLVIMKGKQWMVDWATGALTRCTPPDYGEVETGKEIGELRVGQHGTLIRV